MKKSIIKRVKTRLIAWRLLAMTMLWAAYACLIAGLFIAGDALLVFSQSFRESGLLFFGIALAVPLLFIAGRSMLTSDMAAARWLETRDSALGTALTNALQLSRGNSWSTVEQVLRNRAVSLGNLTAQGIRVWPMIRPAIKRAAVVLACTVLIAMTLGLAFLQAVSMIVPRYMDPAGDHPPWSRVSYLVEPGDVEVLYGQSVDVRVHIQGAPLDTLELVSKSDQGEFRAPMFASPDGSYFQTLSQLRTKTEYHVESGRSCSHRHTIDILLTPKVESLSAQLHFPPYTGMGSRTVRLEGGVERIPAGTRVEITAASNRPLSGGEITLTPLTGGEISTISMTSGKRDFEVSGEITLIYSLIYSVSVTDTDGLKSVDKQTGRLDLIPDKRPRIFVTEPGKEALATPESQIPVRIMAEDDYGLDNVFWFRGINRSVERASQMEGQPGVKRLKAAAAFDLADLGVNPGDVIDYFFEAVDTNPNGPGVSTSRMFSLKIISVEEYENLIKRQKLGRELLKDYEILGSWLKRLNDRSRDLHRDLEQGVTAQELAPALDLLKRDLIKYQEKLNQVLQDKQYLDIERYFHQTLTIQAEKLKILGEKLDQGANIEESIRLAASTLEELAAIETKEIGEPVRELKSVLAVMDHFSRFETLVSLQKELTRLAARFSQDMELSRINRMELQEIANVQKKHSQEMENITESLEDLLQELSQHQEYIPLHNRVVGFLTQANKLEIAYDLKEAGEHFSDMEGPEGYEKALRASKNMEQMLAQCSGLSQAALAALASSTGLAGMLGDTLKQLMQGQGSMYAQGKNGYSMLAQQTALYGPGKPPPAENADALQGNPGSDIPGEKRPVLDKDAKDPELDGAPGSLKIKLDTDVNYPMRYRKLVGDYFKKIAETGSNVPNP